MPVHTFLLALGQDAATGSNQTNVIEILEDETIVEVVAVAKTGPAGANWIADINLDGTSIWNSTPANRITILGGQTSGVQASFDTAALPNGGILTIDTDQVGSSTAGQDISVFVRTTIDAPVIGGRNIVADGAQLDTNTSQIATNVSDIGDNSVAIVAVDGALTSHTGLTDEHIDWTAASAGTIDPTNYSAGDVSKVGTPADNQVGVWTGDGTIEGDANLTWGGSQLDVIGVLAIDGGDGSDDDLVQLRQANSGDSTGIVFKDWAGTSRFRINRTTAGDVTIFNTQASRDLIFGTNNITRFHIDDVGVLYAGNGITSATPADGYISGTGGSGTDKDGASLYLGPGPGTGAGDVSPGKLVLQSYSAEGSGSTPQTPIDTLTAVDGGVAIGIDTLLSGHLLDVHASGAAVFAGMGDISGSGPLFYYGSTGSVAYINSRRSHNLQLWADNDPKLTVTTTGRVGINDESPGTTLDIKVDSTAVGGVFVDTPVGYLSKGLRVSKGGVVHFTIEAAGDILQGTTTIPTGTVGKSLIFGDNGGDPTPGTDTAGVFAKDDGDGTVRMFAVDEGGGNATQLTGCYGGISVESNATATTISASSTDFSNAVQVTVYDTNETNQGCTPDHTNDHVTVDVDGDYKITLSVIFSGGANANYSGSIFKNNGATRLGKRWKRKIGTGGDIGSTSTSTRQTLSAGDTIEHWLQNEDSTADATVVCSILDVEKCN